jgi:hypothetical protein
LIELFHWPPNDLAQADIDQVLPFAIYYPHWKEQSGKSEQEEKVFADQADWL